MQAKIEELKKARELRGQGKSVREIARELNVSKGSVSAWVRDIRLSQDQYDSIYLKWKISSKRGNDLAGKLNQEKYLQLRKGYQEEGKDLARKRDPDFIAGCMLYWAEGTKSRAHCQITNSDANMLKYFISFLKKYFSVKDEDIWVGCHYYNSNGLSNIEVERYWLEKLGVPQTSLRKTSVNRMTRTSDKKRQERTKYGVAKVGVHDVRIVQMIYGAIQEIGNFENPEWVE